MFNFVLKMHQKRLMTGLQSDPLVAFSAAPDPLAGLEKGARKAE